MKVLLKLAFRNLISAGLRTWLNVVVLSLAFVVIIWTQGIYKGMGEQATRVLIDLEYGGGQYWHETFDPFNPLTIEDSHAKIPDTLKNLISEGKATSVLIVQGAIYPDGRFISVLIKGIDPQQKILSLPSNFLYNNSSSDEIPAFIGARMAKTAKLKPGDAVILRWRDSKGVFDARILRIVKVFSSIAQSVDIGQVWVPLKTLQSLAKMEEEGTIIILSKETTPPPLDIPGWKFKDLDFLLKGVNEVVISKTLGASIIYVVLLFMAMLAIFNTQVLSIFRRIREIGTLIALGFTRSQVILLFTIEGAINAILAGILALIYGYPILSRFARSGWAMPKAVDSYGFAIGERLMPVFSAGLIVGTVVLIMLITTIVSFLPARRLSHLKPTDALRGRMQ